MATRWKIFEKQGGRTSRYYKYTTKVVVISNQRGMLLSPATMELLGNPDRVLLLNDGNGHMGINPVTKNDPEYENAFTVQKPGRNDKNPPSSQAMSSVNCKKYLEMYHINPKAVFSTVSVEDGILVIDLNRYEPVNIRS